MNPFQSSAHGFRIAELVVSLAIVVLVLFLVITPAGRPTRGKAQRVKCINNLKNLTLASRIYAEENPDARSGQTLPNRISITAADYFRIFSNELSTAKVLICPSDAHRTEATNFMTLSNTNVSYFANAFVGTNQADPSTFLFGDRNLQTSGVAVPSGATLRLHPDLDLRWTKELHDDQGDIAMGDGSVQQFSSKRLRVLLRESTDTNSLLLIP